MAIPKARRAVLHHSTTGFRRGSRGAQNTHCVLVYQLWVRQSEHEDWKAGKGRSWKDIGADEDGFEGDADAA